MYIWKKFKCSFRRSIYKVASSEEILPEIEIANPKCYLTSDYIKYLKKEGVSQRVIETMLNYQ